MYTLQTPKLYACMCMYICLYIDIQKDQRPRSQRGEGTRPNKTRRGKQQTQTRQRPARGIPWGGGGGGVWHHRWSRAPRPPPLAPLHGLWSRMPPLLWGGCGGFGVLGLAGACESRLQKGSKGKRLRVNKGLGRVWV